MKRTDSQMDVSCNCLRRYHEVYGWRNWGVSNFLTEDLQADLGRALTLNNIRSRIICYVTAAGLGGTCIKFNMIDGDFFF